MGQKLHAVHRGDLRGIGHDIGAGAVVPALARIEQQRSAERIGFAGARLEIAPGRAGERIGQSGRVGQEVFDCRRSRCRAEPIRPGRRVERFKDFQSGKLRQVFFGRVVETEHALEELRSVCRGVFPALLVGVTLAYTGSVVLRQYGGDIYIADTLNKTYTMQLYYDNPDSPWVAGFGRLVVTHAGAPVALDAEHDRAERPARARLVADYIAGMTDRYALALGVERVLAGSRGNVVTLPMTPGTLLVFAGTAQLTRPAKNNEAQARTAHMSTHFVAPWARGHGLAGRGRDHAGRGAGVRGCGSWLA